MDRGIYSLLNGKLVYQLKKNGILYDASTNKPIVNKYQRAKENVRNEAVKWQNSFNDHNYSYEELTYYGNYFEKLAKKYGLVKEFRENGII